jgi:hypothetical protein
MSLFKCCDQEPKQIAANNIPPEQWLPSKISYGLECVLFFHVPYCSTSLNPTHIFQTGKTGLPTLHKLASNPQFSIHLLVRNPITTYTSLPTTLASVTQVDYTDHSSLVSLLTSKSADIIIVFASFAPGMGFDLKHIALINAAIAAGVKYFIPSEWALDTAGVSESTHEKIGPTLPTNMVLAPKRVTHNYLLCRAAEGKIRFALIYTGVFLEACSYFPFPFPSPHPPQTPPTSLPGFKNKLVSFNFSTHHATLPDNGIPPFPATSLRTLATALTTLLTNPTLIDGSFYHISDGVLTQRGILRLVSHSTNSVWTSSSYSIAAAAAAAAENMKKGVYGIREYAATLTVPFFGGLQSWNQVDNEILGITEEERVDLKEEVGRLAREAAALAGEGAEKSRI